MNEKIKWYREVLELEPSSKVFFPLARLFSDNGQPAEAVETLRQGLERHPEHLEARMLLIECLDTLGRELEADDEAEALSDRLRRYPQFWQAWGRTLAAQPDSRDASLALDFLAASFGDTPVSWAAVIEQGLRSLGTCPGGAGDDEPAVYPPAHAAAPPVHQDDAAEAAGGGQEQESGTETVAAATDNTQISPAAPEAVPSGGVTYKADIISEAQADEDDDIPDEPLSLRTRSMAEVLAQQGDIKGAMEILDELLAGTADSEVRRDIMARKDSLALAGSAGAVKEEGAEQPLHSKHKLLTMLETLAERLEARAAG
ncbi:tetratricopeptide repeat protein [Oleidesulfovibrio alaskensis]|jgi:tetratricopeptide (TPR) repeat protein|uniref:tetratricopeptide repeat protein n=1 Tax=Oleidesulfovibrio alaskensis TaxID=58180 RepID=UPI001A366F3A|nr:tetratricopeptide repeat protein [Oleidesulfovibrio alaskensis]MBL3582743.1 tetratricopeptide repeat protein [Oleidesulfovibrio alaskensis]